MLRDLIENMNDAAICFRIGSEVNQSKMTHIF